MSTYQRTMSPQEAICKIESSLSNIQELNEQKVQEIKRAFRLTEQIQEASLRVAMKNKIYKVL